LQNRKGQGGNFVLQKTGIPGILASAYFNAASIIVIFKFSPPVVLENIKSLTNSFLDYLPGSIGESFAPFAALCQIYSLFTPPFSPALLQKTSCTLGI
jgi:hypothetical protein